MRSLTLSLCILTCLFLLGCNTNDVIQFERNQMLKPVNDDLHDQLGYVHYTKEELNNKPEQNQTRPINRDVMANVITTMILENDGFDEVATLVTDSEVLIAFDNNDKLDKDKAENLAQKTAKSVLPRYFDIHASSNRTLIPDIHSLHNTRMSDDNYQNTIDNIINEMNK